MRVVWLIALLLGGLGLVSGAPAAAGEPLPTEPNPAEPKPTVPNPGEPLPHCAEDPASATLAVKLAFSDLVVIHRARVPGPSGQRILDGKVDALLLRILDLERFTAGALAPLWNELEPPQRQAWQEDLRVGLRGHYLRRLTEDASPVGQRLDIAKADVRCDRATVQFTLGRRNSRHHTDVALELLWTGVTWRAFDVSVDGVSLLETWKNRFRQIYRDGGIAAVDEHLRQLASRHRTP